MKKNAIMALSVTAVAALASLAHPTTGGETDPQSRGDAPTDSVPQAQPEEERLSLCDEDYAEAADSLGVEVAAIHAVIDVEAGVNHRGIWEQGKPLVAFSINLFRSQARKRGIDLSKYASVYPDVFSAPKRKKYGSYEAAQYARLQQAMAIDSVAAINSTYWGMFQITGSHWKFCGCESVDEFVRRMSTSERNQLDMFVEFLRSTGMDKPLRERQWAKFARKYNGPSYTRHGYHTKLESAYKKYSAGA